MSRSVGRINGDIGCRVDCRFFPVLGPDVLAQLLCFWVGAYRLEMWSGLGR